MLWLIPEIGVRDFVACTWMYWPWERRISLVHNEVVNRGAAILRFVPVHLANGDLFWVSRSRSLFALFAVGSSFHEIYYVINASNRSSISEKNKVIFQHTACVAEDGATLDLYEMLFLLELQRLRFSMKCISRGPGLFPLWSLLNTHFQGQWVFIARSLRVFSRLARVKLVHDRSRRVHFMAVHKISGGRTVIVVQWYCMQYFVVQVETDGISALQDHAFRMLCDDRQQF